MCIPAIAAVASIGMGIAGSIQRNNANRRAAQNQRDAAQREQERIQWQREETLRVATQNYHQNILNTQGNYLDQVRASCLLYTSPSPRDS